MNYKNITILTILILLLVAGSATGSYYIAKKSFEHTATTTPSQVENNSKFDWKSYKNEEYDYIINYPEQLSVHNFKQRVLNDPRKWVREIRLSEVGFEDKNGERQAFIEVLKKGTSLEKIKALHGFGGPGKTITDNKITTKEGYQGKKICDESRCLFIINHNNMVYVIYPAGAVKKYTDLAKDIFLSLKFIDYR